MWEGEDRASGFYPQGWGFESLRGTWKEIFEQLVQYTLSPDYEEMKTLIESIVAGKKEKLEVTERAA